MSASRRSLYSTPALRSFAVGCLVGAITVLFITGSLSWRPHRDEDSHRNENTKDEDATLPPPLDLHSLEAKISTQPPTPEDVAAARELVVLVAYSMHVHPHVEVRLRELERRGFTVIRSRAAALDNACSLMATQIVTRKEGESPGFSEMLWLDGTTDFEVDAVHAVRRAGVSIVGGVAPREDGSGFNVLLPSATHPERSSMILGAAGGLIEVMQTGMGFLYVRAAVFTAIQAQFKLPHCNPGFEDELVPYFKSFVAERNGAPVYLIHNEAFCERARRAGFKIFVDTRIRLSIVTTRLITWEDVVERSTRLIHPTLNVPAHLLKSHY